MKSTWLTFCFVTFSVGAVPVLGQGVIYSNDFNDDDVGAYTQATLDADWNSPSGNQGVANNRTEIVSGSQAYNGGKSLKVDYPLGGVGSSAGGAQWRMDLGQGYEELYLSYRLKFGAGFDFVRGGKLPGLAGGAGNSGGNPPSPTNPDGWSARMMWRTDGSGGSPINDTTAANAVQYVYHADQPTQFGEDFRYDDGSGSQWKTFESDRWYQLQHRIVMNTPGQNDGIIQGWLDGEMVLDAQTIRFRDDASLQIDQLYFSTFFGGSGTEWAPSKNESAYFDDVVVSTNSIISSVPEPSVVLPGMILSALLCTRRRTRR